MQVVSSVSLFGDVVLGSINGIESPLVNPRIGALMYTLKSERVVAPNVTPMQSSAALEWAPDHNKFSSNKNSVKYLHKGTHMSLVFNEISQGKSFRGARGKKVWRSDSPSDWGNFFSSEYETAASYATWGNLPNVSEVVKCAPLLSSRVVRWKRLTEPKDSFITKEYWTALQNVIFLAKALTPVEWTVGKYSGIYSALPLVDPQPFLGNIVNEFEKGWGPRPRTILPHLNLVEETVEEKSYWTWKRTGINQHSDHTPAGTPGPSAAVTPVVTPRAAPASSSAPELRITVQNWAMGHVSPPAKEQKPDSPATQSKSGKSSGSPPNKIAAREESTPIERGN